MKRDGLDLFYHWIEDLKKTIATYESLVCTKNKYMTKAVAKSVASVRRRKTGILLRVYLCDKCQHFHLTKSQLRKKGTN